MDIDITGARILISRPEWVGFMLTETVVVTWVVMLILVLACRFMTAHLEVHPTKKRQVIAEWIVTSIRDMVQTNMGEKYAHTWYVPFIGAMFALSAGCSLSSVVGAYAPTSDLSTVLGWALFAITDFGQLGAYLSHLFSGPLWDATSAYLLRCDWLLLVLAVVGCTSLPKRLWEKREQTLSPALSDGLRTVWVVIVLLVSIAFLVGDSYNPFLYFRF